MKKLAGSTLTALALAGLFLVGWVSNLPPFWRWLVIVLVSAAVLLWLLSKVIELVADVAAAARKVAAHVRPWFGPTEVTQVVAPRPLDEQPHFLYRWFAPDGDLLYIGISNDLARRTGQHVADKPWMTPGVRCEAESYPNRAAVLAAEERAIYAENPRHNVVHNRGPLW